LRGVYQNATLSQATLTTFLHPCAYLYGFQTVQTGREGKATVKK
jgi:hypothetical protein